MTVSDLERFEGEYRGSAEEREDLRKAYVEAEGDMGQVRLPSSSPALPPPLPLLHHLQVLDTVMCAREEDEQRFRVIIDEMIADKEVEAFPAYKKKDKKEKAKRKRAAETEAAEAEEAAAELGLGAGEEGLRSLILARQADRGARAEGFLDGLAAKYATKPKKGKGKKK